MQPVLGVSPQQVLVGDAVSVKASGLSRGETVLLTTPGKLEAF